MEMLKAGEFILPSFGEAHPRELPHDAVMDRIALVKIIAARVRITVALLYGLIDGLDKNFHLIPPVKSTLEGKVKRRLLIQRVCERLSA